MILYNSSKDFLTLKKLLKLVTLCDLAPGTFGSFKWLETNFISAEFINFKLLPRCCGKMYSKILNTTELLDEPVQTQEYTIEPSLNLLKDTLLPQCFLNSAISVLSLASSFFGPLVTNFSDSSKSRTIFNLNELFL